jgi:hypothetical protein
MKHFKFTLRDLFWLVLVMAMACDIYRHADRALRFNSAANETAEQVAAQWSISLLTLEVFALCLAAISFRGLTSRTR